jgi:hypothetical protein
MSLSERDLAEMWTTVFRARATCNDAGLGVVLAPDDLVRVIEELLAVVDRLRPSYDAQYAHLWRARDLLSEVASATPIDSPHDEPEWHRVSHDLTQRAARLLLATAPRDGGT